MEWRVVLVIIVVILSEIYLLFFASPHWPAINFIVIPIELLLIGLWLLARAIYKRLRPHKNTEAEKNVR
jgi:hypothetical protein